MKVKAAIAMEAEKPLIIDEIDLEGPRAGEVLVRLRATGVCQRHGDKTHPMDCREQSSSEPATNSRLKTQSGLHHPSGHDE